MSIAVENVPRDGKKAEVAKNQYARIIGVLAGLISMFDGDESETRKWNSLSELCCRCVQSSLALPMTHHPRLIKKNSLIHRNDRVDLMLTSPDTKIQSILSH